MALEDGTAGEFADTWNDERGGVTQKDGIDEDGVTERPCRPCFVRSLFFLVHDGLKRLPPAPASKHLCQNTEGETEQHPRPVHFVPQDVVETLEVEVAIHPVENGSAQHERQQYFDGIVQQVFLVHKFSLQKYI